MMAFMGWPYADAMAAFLFSFLKKAKVYFTSSNYHQSLVFLLQL